MKSTVLVSLTLLWLILLTGCPNLFDNPPDTYSVTYDGNGNDGGEVPVDAGEYETGATVTVSANTGGLSKAESAFDGWNTQQDGEGASYPPGTTFTMGSADVTLYAQWRLNPGLLVPDFGTDGMVTYGDATGGASGGLSISAEADTEGFIYVTGYADNTITGNTDMTLLKYRPTGVLDTGFGEEGVVLGNTLAGVTDGSGVGIALDSLGNVHVVGVGFGASATLVVWKFDSSGQPVTSFGGGVVTHDLGNSYGAYGIAVDDTGSVFACGQVHNGTDRDLIVLKYDSTGTLDDSFGDNGVFIHHNAAGGDGDDIGYSLVLDSVGSVLISGESVGASGNSDMVLWKLTSSGELEADFGTNGIVVSSGTAGGDGFDGAWSLALDSNGDIYAAGRSFDGTQLVCVLWKYSSAGDSVVEFGSGGVVVYSETPGGPDFGMTDIVAVDDSDRVYVTAAQLLASGTQMALWRYVGDGTLDSSFGTDGMAVQPNPTTTWSSGIGIGLDAEYNAYVAGTVYDGSNEVWALWKFSR